MVAEADGRTPGPLGTTAAVIQVGSDGSEFSLLTAAYNTAIILM